MNDEKYVYNFIITKTDWSYIIMFKIYLETYSKMFVKGSSLTLQN